MFSKWTQVLDAQLECQQFWQNDYYRDRVLELITESQAGDGYPKNVEIASIIAVEEMDKFDPVFISEDIVDLATQAAQSFDLEPHRVGDFFTPAGFALLERPFTCRRLDGVTLEVMHIWWMWSQESGELPVGMVVMGGHAWHPEDGTREEQLARLHHAFRWVPQAIYRVDEDDTPMAFVDTAEVDPVKFVQALMRLAQQPLAQHSEAAADRPTRRRVQRAGGTPRPITTITLRRPKGAPSETPGKREYTHRWMVHGFWRRQWYPSLQMHRQIWINDYVKGPEDAPLVLKHRRFDFRR